MVALGMSFSMWQFDTLGRVLSKVSRAPRSDFARTDHFHRARVVRTDHDSGVLARDARSLAPIERPRDLSRVNGEEALAELARGHERLGRGDWREALVAFQAASAL